MKLWHRRGNARHVGPLGAGDEDDCYTASGRRRGIWLTDERLTGADVVTLNVRGTVLDEFEVTASGDSYRTFVVPAKVLTDPTSRPVAEVPPGA